MRVGCGSERNGAANAPPPLLQEIECPHSEQRDKGASHTLLLRGTALAECGMGRIDDWVTWHCVATGLIRSIGLDWNGLIDSIDYLRNTTPTQRDRRSARRTTTTTTATTTTITTTYGLCVFWLDL